MKVGIVGAGIVGKLMALGLVQEGYAVTLFDRNPPVAQKRADPLFQRGCELSQNCSQVAAGLLTPLSELDKSDILIYQLGMDAFKNHWPSIITALPEPVDFRDEGSLILSHPKDRSEFAQFIHHISHRLGSDDVYQYLQQAAIQQLEPEISHFQEGYYFPEEGCLDAQHLLMVLDQFLRQKGVEYFTDSVVEEIKSNQIMLKSIPGSPPARGQDFDWVLDCRGLQGRKVFSDLRGVRGELLWLHAPEVNIQRPIRFLHPRYSLYIVPRKNNIYLIGASEIDAEDFSAVSVRTTLELLTAAYYVHSGFAEARVIQANAQCRPTLSHHLPQIKYQKGLIAINGLYRHGYLISPALVNDVLLYLNKGVEAVCYPQLWERSHHDNNSSK